MSGGKMSRNAASLTARCQGGGPKLAGTAPRVGVNAILLSKSYDKAPNTTVTREAFKVLGEVCRNAGCGCDAAINSLWCQTNGRCKKLFPYNQNPANSGVYPTRWG